MATNYHVYSNDLAGGPINYGSPITTTASLAFATAPIPTGSDARFAVRAFDTVTGLEDLNTDAIVRIVTDAMAVDRTLVPYSPVGLSGRATAGGSAVIEWSQPRGPRARRAVSFKAWTTPAPGPINYALPPALIVPNLDGDYVRGTLSGLSDGVTYLVAVRSVNANGDDGNTVTISITADATGPDPVDELTGSLI